jgi:hypothetical protein
MAAAGAAARCTQRATEGYPVVVGEEEHVPTRRRQVGFPGDLYLHHAPGLGDDRHVHQTLTGVERVRVAPGRIRLTHSMLPASGVEMVTVCS